MNLDARLPQELRDCLPPEAQAYIQALEARIAALEATLQQLQEQLQQDSRTSSRPPSSDPPQARHQRPRHEPSGRRPGGQPGHEGQTRMLVPVAEVEVVMSIKPARCRRCQHSLHGDDPQPRRHQVTESPPVRPTVIEYQLHRLVCPVCGEATRAEVPQGVPTGEFGPRVQAIAALCTGAYHLSKRTTQCVLADLFGVHMSGGTIANLEQATVHALAGPLAEARAYVQAQPAAYLDETGWREGAQRAWLWTAVTAWVTIFVVRRSRGAQVAHELLGERFWGYLVTDRWSAYTWYPMWRRQLCWAHLRRDIEAMIARGGGSQAIGEALRAQARQMFHWWHRVHDGTLAPASFASYMRPIRQEVERLLEVGQTCGVPKTAGVCRAILKVRQALWTFVRHPEVEPTNNAAERAIRPGVLWRKGSFGTHSAQGSQFVEAMMTTVATLKPQHRNVLDYVSAACEAILQGEPAPSLLPSAETLKHFMHRAA
jgi:transposase